MAAAHKVVDSMIERIDAARVKADERVAALRKDVAGRVRKSLGEDKMKIFVNLFWFVWFLLARKMSLSFCILTNSK